MVMEKLGGYAYKLWMHLFGDPLLTPGLPEMIGLAKAAGIDNVGMSANALALSPETGRALCRAGVDTLILSLDATTQDVYNIVRAGGKLDKAVENCERLLELPERKNIRNLVIQFIEMPENKHQAAEFIKRWWTAPGLLDTRVRVFDLIRPPQLERVFPALPGPAFGSRSPRESNDGCTGS